MKGCFFINSPNSMDTTYHNGFNKLMNHQSLLERHRIRFDFLNKLNDLSGGDRTQLIHGCKVTEELGLRSDSNEAKQAANYLKGENLVEDMRIVCGCPLGIMRITHSGIRELEGAIRDPNNPSTYFEPVNLMYQSISVTNSSGVQVGNNNSQTTTVNIQKNTRIFRDAEAAIQNGVISDSERELTLSKLKDFELAVDSQTKSKK